MKLFGKKLSLTRFTFALFFFLNRAIHFLHLMIHSFSLMVNLKELFKIGFLSLDVGFESQIGKIV